MKLPKIKVSDMMNWEPKPCEDSWPLIEKLAERKVSALDVLTMPELDGADDWRLWTALHEDLIDAKTLRLFACDCAERAMKKAKWTDKQSWHAVKIARAFASGEATEEELDAARAATRAVARDAARAVARDTARDTARAAARDAAWAAEAAGAAGDAAGAAGDAAWAAAWAAARVAAGAARAAAGAAARDAAWAAEHNWQIKHLIKMLRKLKEWVK